MVDLGLEVVAVVEQHVGRHRGEHARNERLAVAADQQDGIELRHRRDDAGEPRLQPRLRRADLGVRHATHDLVDLREGAIDGLEHLQRLLLHDIERARDALVGHRMHFAVGEPGGIGEERSRQDHRRDHRQLQQADG